MRERQAEALELLELEAEEGELRERGDDEDDPGDQRDAPADAVVVEGGSQGLSISRSDRVISRISSSNVVVGFQPSSRSALA